jgi:anaerobic magnesium-protoporphyrin IX monomethyl ester cyclase
MDEALVMAGEFHLQKILCLYPPYEQKANFVMGLPYIASYLRNVGFRNIFGFDAPAMGATYEDVMEFIKKIDIDVVLMSVPFTPWTDSAMTMLRELRKTDIYVIVGGIMPTLMPELFVSDADVVVVGDGEKISPMLLKDHSQKGIIKGEPLPIDELPFPAWDLFPIERYDLRLLWASEKAMPVLVSRGCPFNCDFCSNWFLTNRTVHYREAESVIEEIEHYIQQYGVSTFELHAENFTLNRKFVIEFCQRIIDKELKIKWWAQTRANLVDEETLPLMKKAGCAMLSFGVESGSTEIRKEIDKNISDNEFYRGVSLVRKNGILSYCGFIVGHRLETMDTIRKTTLMAHNLDPDYIGVQIATPYPKTCLREKIEDSQMVAKHWSDYVTSKTTFIPKGLAGKNIEAIREITFLDFYSRKLKRMKTLWRFSHSYFLAYFPAIFVLFLVHRFYDGILVGDWLLWLPKII